MIQVLVYLCPLPREDRNVWYPVISSYLQLYAYTCMVSDVMHVGTFS